MNVDRRRLAIAGIFFFQAFAAGSFLTRIPDIQRVLGVDEAVLGLVFLGQPVGSLLLILFASPIVERAGTRNVMLVGLPLLAAVTALVAITDSVALAFAGLAVYGATFAVTNVAMNVEADRIEAASGERVMNTCHGLASLGLLVTSLVGAFARGIGLPQAIHLTAVVPVVVAASLLLILPLNAAPPRHYAEGRRSVFPKPTAMTMCLVAVLLSAFLLEGTTRSWSVIYMRDSFSVAASAEVLSLTAFLTAMSVGRLLGDRNTRRFGPVIVGRWAIGIAAAGLALIVLAPVYWLGLAGFVLLGLGTSVIYPLTISAAARLGDRPASENIAAVTMVGALIVLAAPAAIGYAAANWGIRIAFAVIAPALLLSFVLSRFLAGRRP